MSSLGIASMPQCIHSEAQGEQITYVLVIKKQIASDRQTFEKTYLTVQQLNYIVL